MHCIIITYFLENLIKSQKVPLLFIFHVQDVISTKIFAFWMSRVLRYRQKGNSSRKYKASIKTIKRDLYYSFLFVVWLIFLISLFYLTHVSVLISLERNCRSFYRFILNLSSLTNLMAQCVQPSHIDVDHKPTQPHSTTLVWLRSCCIFHWDLHKNYKTMTTTILFHRRKKV